MSLRGRYVIDRMKRAVGSYFSFPVPPYQDPNYWESVYRKLGPADVFEWGNFTADDLVDYKCRSLSFNTSELMAKIASHQTNGWLPDPSSSSNQTMVSLREMLGLPALAEGDHQPNKTTKTEQPILVLGCGNSRFGQQILEYGCRGPIVHVDASSRVIHDMKLRCKEEKLNNLLFVQDDAAVLSALQPNTMAAAVDKGMVDAIFCSDDYETCWEMIKSTHRVLQNGGVFACFSFSQPDYILPKILLPSERFNTQRHLRQVVNMWDAVQVQQLDFIYSYRFIKATVKPIQSVDLRGKMGKRQQRQ